ncbi:MAG: hypothetical protein Kow0010_24680 [Dehalococcoidia bacterium]
MPATISQINGAGRILRAWWQDPNALILGAEEVWAYGILTEFRASHAVPLIKANNGLRSMVRTEGCAVQVSQRLKRAASIIDKLARHSTMALARMQDIGGCRAILADIDEVRRVEKRLRGLRPPLRVDDYISHTPHARVGRGGRKDRRTD